jgi:thiol-disulfide isomerase/thioredoxin
MSGPAAEAKAEKPAGPPFHPDAFKAPEDWRGKAVLVELFTGSECPPCVGADLGLDGLIESYPSKYLAVLEYHLPIPRPDPMMNPDTKERQDFYEIRSTPTVVVDGAKLPPGGGARKDAERLYRQYKEEIDGRLGQDPALAISATATLKGDRVLVSCEFSKIVEGAEFFIALVQDGEKYTGANGVELHRMVVRDLGQLPALPEKLKLEPTISLTYLESVTDEYLTEFENTSTRFKDFKFPVRHHRIDRGRLKVVLFAQDPETKKIYNAVVADVAAV